MLKHLHKVRQTYAPPDHYVFDLAPPELKTQACQFMEEMDWPAVNEDTVWIVYSELLGYFCAMEDEALEVVVALSMRVIEEDLPKGFTPEDEQFVEVDPYFEAT